MERRGEWEGDKPVMSRSILFSLKEDDFKRSYASFVSNVAVSVSGVV